MNKYEKIEEAEKMLESRKEMLSSIGGIISESLRSSLLEKINNENKILLEMIQIGAVQSDILKKKSEYALDDKYFIKKSLDTTSF